MTWQYSIYTISNKLMFYPIIQTVMDKNVKLRYKIQDGDQNDNVKL